MKRLALIATAACMTATGAFAADLPSRRSQPAYAPPPPIPVFTWSGVYIGGNAGYAFDNRTNYNLGGNTPVTANAIFVGNRPGYAQTRSSGFTGGGQIGYNLELKSNFLGGLGGFGTSIGNGVGSILGLGNAGLVGGIEADAAYTDLRGQSDYFSPINGIDTNFRSRLDFLGTVRGRIGVAFDRLLVFGTGGFAYGGARNATNLYTAAGVNNYTGYNDNIRTGVAYGGGIEYALPTAAFLNPFHSSAVTIKVEYLHYDLGTTTILVNNNLGTGNSYGEGIRNNGNLVRAGINYKFNLGGTSSPVVARY